MFVVASESFLLKRSIYLAKVLIYSYALATLLIVFESPYLFILYGLGDSILCSCAVINTGETYTKIYFLYIASCNHFYLNSNCFQLYTLALFWNMTKVFFYLLQEPKADDETDKESELKDHQIPLERLIEKLKTDPTNVSVTSKILCYAEVATHLLCQSIYISLNFTCNVLIIIILLAMKKTATVFAKVRIPVSLLLATTYRVECPVGTHPLCGASRRPLGT